LQPLVQLVNRHRDGIEREPWATGRVSTSNENWLDDHAHKYPPTTGSKRPPWYIRVTALLSKLWSTIIKNMDPNGFRIF